MKKNKKREERNTFIEEYMIEGLNTFGNTVVTDKFLEKYPEEQTIEELRKLGFNVRIFKTIRGTNVIEKVRF